MQFPQLTTFEIVLGSFVQWKFFFFKDVTIQYNPLYTLYFSLTASFSFLSKVNYAATFTKVY